MRERCFEQAARRRFKAHARGVADETRTEHRAVKQLAATATLSKRHAP
jgi:hypothetical protein